MQTRLTVGVLVLHAERLVCAIRYLSFLFQTTPSGVFAVPQQIAMDVGHFFRGCRFGRSGSSDFVVGFLLLRWSSCVPVPKVRKNLGRCRYRCSYCPKRPSSCLLRLFITHSTCMYSTYTLH